MTETYTLEAHLQRLATKEDIQSVKKLIEKSSTENARRESNTHRWLIGVIAAAAISTLAALIRTFL